jgi:carbamoyltransferase
MIVGINAYTYCAGAAIYDGTVKACIEEERLNREKKTKEFPHLALSQLAPDGVSGSDFEAVAYPWRPGPMAREFGKLILRGFPRSWALLHPASDPNGNPYLPLQGLTTLRSDLRKHGRRRKAPRLLFVPHHGAHAALAFFGSPFDRAIVLVVDAFGDDCSISVWLGEGGSLRQVYKNRMSDSLGILYSCVTLHLGYRTGTDEGKVMALAGLGTDRFVPEFEPIVSGRPDGALSFDYSYLNFQLAGEMRPFTQKFIEAFGPPRSPGEDLRQEHYDLAAALQHTLERCLLHVATHFARQYRVSNLALAGGVSLNCTTNGRLAREAGVESVFVPPNPDDSGSPLGAAMYAHHCVVGRPRGEPIEHSYYGPEYGSHQVERALGSRPARLVRDPAEAAAALLAQGRTVGWLQGRMEMGPRALGNRSILADPRDPGMKDRLNEQVKHRESYRPYAPSVLREELTDWFPESPDSPFMSFSSRVAPGREERVPAVLHVDQTARLQTVDNRTAPLYHRLISAFARRTGVPMVLNTSLNDREPICCTPEDAVRCFDGTQLDALIIGDHVLLAEGIDTEVELESAQV